MYNFIIDGVQIPIAPSAMETKINNKNQKITLVDDGEINVLKKPGLTDFSFTVLLPNQHYPFAIYTDGFQYARYYLDKLEALKIGEKPFYLIVNRIAPNGRLLFDTNVLVSLEDYVIKENANNGTDIEVKLNFKQYKPYGTKLVKIEEQPTAKIAQIKVDQPRDTSTKQTPKTHTVVSGDTLWAIAKKYLGNGSKYTELAKLNNISNPNIIRVGQVIKLE